MATLEPLENTPFHICSIKQHQFFNSSLKMAMERRDLQFYLRNGSDYPLFSRCPMLKWTLNSLVICRRIEMISQGRCRRKPLINIG